MVILFITQNIDNKQLSINVGPYRLFWQPALVCHTLILYMSLFIGQIKMLACFLSNYFDLLFGDGPPIISGPLALDY